MVKMQTKDLCKGDRRPNNHVTPNRGTNTTQALMLSLQRNKNSVRNRLMDIFFSHQGQENLFLNEVYLKRIAGMAISEWKFVCLLVFLPKGEAQGGGGATGFLRPVHLIKYCCSYNLVQKTKTASLAVKGHFLPASFQSNLIRPPHPPFFFRGFLKC